MAAHLIAFIGKCRVTQSQGGTKTAPYQRLWHEVKINMYIYVYFCKPYRRDMTITTSVTFRGPRSPNGTEKNNNPFSCVPRTNIYKTVAFTITFTLLNVRLDHEVLRLVT